MSVNADQDNNSFELADTINTDANTGNTISGFVWLDNNGDGLQDQNEPGFAQTVPDFGAPNIALYSTGSTTLIDFSPLDESSNGEYSFEKLPDGDYYACVSNEFRPLGLTVTTPNAGDDAIDSDFDGSVCSYNISVADGQVVMRDLGLVIEIIDPDTGNQITGFVWLDNNSDGLQDPTEPGFVQTIPDVGAPNVALYPTGSTTLIDTFSLDESSNGEYSFDNVPDGDYYVCVSQEFRSLGLAVTTLNAGDDEIDSDFDFVACSYDISITGGQILMRDLGLVDETIDPDTGNSISGIVWNDANQDTRIDDNEDRVATIVGIYELPEKVGSFVQHIVADQNGFYEFTNLPAGEYKVVAIDGDSESSVTASVSGVNSSVSIDFPVDRAPSIIKVDGTSCTLQNALDTIASLEGDCVRNNEDPNVTHILLEPGSQHPSVGFTPAFSPEGHRVNIYGNSASINRFSIQFLSRARATIINASLDYISNGSWYVFGSMSLSHADIDSASSPIDGSNISFDYCKIGNASAGGLDPAFLFINSSIVLGNANPAVQVVNSTIEGTLFTHPNHRIIGIATIKDSNVNQIAVRSPGLFGPLGTTGLDTIENSTIGGIFISNYSGADVSEECIDAEGVIDPRCLLLD